MMTKVQVGRRGLRVSRVGAAAAEAPAGCGGGAWGWN